MSFKYNNIPVLFLDIGIYRSSFKSIQNLNFQYYLLKAVAHVIDMS